MFRGRLSLAISDQFAFEAFAYGTKAQKNYAGEPHFPPTNRVEAEPNRTRGTGSNQIKVYSVLTRMSQDFPPTTLRWTRTSHEDMYKSYVRLSYFRNFSLPVRWRAGQCGSHNLVIVVVVVVVASVFFNDLGC